jgi:acyl-CoA synthetase (AMP-forming)/AMP-acid ligase II
MAGPGYKRYFSTVSYCFSAATSMASEIVRKWIDTYGITIHEAYGMTETASLVTYNHMYQHRIGSVGTPAGIVEVRIVDPGGKAAQAGQTGEIAIRGPNVMKGYLNSPEETAAILRDGWLHSGDVGRLDADGYLYIVDRIKDVIITGGYNVFPSEVEEVLYTHPGVAECAVVGLEHREYGEAVTAYMIFKEGFQPTDEELTTYCRNRRLSLSEKKEAIRELADVFEWRKKTKGLTAVLDKKDESAIFDIANNFGIRHNNPKQKTNYDSGIWYSWMFHFYLATYHAVVRLLLKKEKEPRHATNLSSGKGKQPR